MSTDLATTENRSLSTMTDVDPFLSYADAAKPQHILGNILKHSKGEFLSGVNSGTIPLGTKMIAAMDLLTIGFVRWSDGKPAEHRMTLVASGDRPPRRDDLGDHDTAQWEKDSSGKPRDPWQLTQYLPMVDEGGELFTFSTSSRGGIGAIAELARHYARGRATHRDAFPLVELNVDAYQHASFGRIKIPVFKPVAWESKRTFFEAAGITARDEFDAAATADEMSDSIPF